MMMFSLSAIDPDKMQQAVRNVAGVLNRGGVLWFRDYAEADQAQLKFKKGSRIKQNFYARGDGTRAYFFRVAELDEIMTKAGLEPMGDTRLIERVLLNRKTGQNMHRVWIHGRFQRR